MARFIMFAILALLSFCGAQMLADSAWYFAKTAYSEIEWPGNHNQKRNEDPIAIEPSQPLSRKERTRRKGRSSTKRKR
jgi:hypothetical protein